MSASHSEALLVIEPTLNGHHIRYLEWIVRGAVERGKHVVVATYSESRDNARLNELVSTFRGHLKVEYHTPAWGGLASNGNFLSLLKREMGVAWWMRSVAQKVTARIDLEYVLIPCLDCCLYGLALMPRPFGDLPWAGIAMRPAFHFGKMGVKGPPPSILLTIKEKLYFRLLKSATLRSLFALDPCLVEYTRQIAGNNMRVKYLADPVEMKPIFTRGEARRHFGMSDDSKVVLIYGALGFRKGIRELIEAALSDPDKQVVVFAVGRQNADVAEYMRRGAAHKLRSEGRLFELNRYVSDDDEALVFGACDVVWLGYKEHFGSSGVLTQAAATNRHVISSSWGLLGWLTEKHSLGKVIDISNKAEVLENLRMKSVCCLDADTKGILAGRKVEDFVSVLFGCSNW